MPHCTLCGDFMVNDSQDVKRAHNVIKQHFLCGECRTPFGSGKDLNKHNRMHRPIEVKTVDCPTCRQAITYTSKGPHHAINQHSRKMGHFKCDICMMACNTPQTLCKHKRRQHGIPAFENQTTQQAQHFNDSTSHSESTISAPDEWSYAIPDFSESPYAASSSIDYSPRFSLPTLKPKEESPPPPALGLWRERVDQGTSSNDVQSKQRSNFNMSRPVGEGVVPTQPNTRLAEGDNHRETRVHAARYIPPHACRICQRGLIDPVTTSCGHVFCHSCIIQEITAHLRCPVCHQAILVRVKTEPSDS